MSPATNKSRDEKVASWAAFLEDELVESGVVDRRLIAHVRLGYEAYCAEVASQA